MASSSPAAMKQDAGLHFVVSTDLAKPDPELRKLIRSHVMVGKNRGRTLPPRKTKRPKGQSSSTAGSSASESPATSSPTCISPSVSDTLARAHTPSPRKFGSECSAVHFADHVEPGAVEVVLQFSSIAKQVLFPLESCIFFERRAQDWIAPLVVDPAYLHGMIFTSQYYFDTIASPNSSCASERTLVHFVETLRLLRERLENNASQERISNTTAAAVMGLAGHAYLTGNSRSSKQHMDGLRRIISLRGGVESFRNSASPKLLLEMIRCDIGIAMNSGSKPILHKQSSTPNHFLPYPYPDLKVFLNSRDHRRDGVQHHPPRRLPIVNEELLQAWAVMSDFTNIINLAVESGQCISVDTFLDTMASVMYHLLDLDLDENSADEALRLGLLTFSCSVFLHWHRLGMSYPRIKAAFRDCLLKLGGLHISSSLALWMLMIGAIALFDAKDDWWFKPLFASHLKLCQIDSWDKMLRLLESFMWVGLIHDKPAKIVFDSQAMSVNRSRSDLDE